MVFEFIDQEPRPRPVRIVRPRLYARGEDLPVGTYYIGEVVGSDTVAYVVVRTIGAARWYQLTARENPSWRRWPTRQACAAACMDGDAFDCADWPHWGQP